MRSLLFSKLVNLLYAVALLAVPLSAQTPPPYVNQSNETGLPAHGSFMSSDIDNVNLPSGALHVQIGLYAGKMRGSFSNAEGVRYESKFWMMDNVIASYDGSGHPSAYEYFWKQDSDNAGWQPFGGANQFRVDFTPQSLACKIVDPCPHSPLEPNGCPLPAAQADVYTGFFLTDNNGTRYKFPNHMIVKRDSNPLQCPEFGSNNLLQGISDSGNVELTIDPSPGYPVVSFKFADGRVWNAAGFHDANGNTAGGVDSQGWNLDNMGRRTTRIVPLDTLTPMMAADFQSYDSNGTIQHTRLDYVLITPHHSVSSLPNGLLFVDGTALPMRVLSRILLPNGLSYTFSYDDPDDPGHVNNGELTKITLPVGGYISYRWQTIANRDRRDIPFSAPGTLSDTLDRIDSRVLVERHVSDGAHENVWHYDYTGGVDDAQWTTKVTDPAGNVTIHTFQAPTLYVPALEVSVEEHQGSATPVRLTTKTWQMDGGPTSSRLICNVPSFDAMGNPAGCNSYSYDLPGGARNLRVTDTTQAWLPSNLTAKTHSDFNDCHSYSVPDWNSNVTDCFDHPTKVSEYDYNASAPSRVTTYDYLHNDATVGQSYWNAHILDQVRFKRVYKGDATTLAAETEYRYDTTTLQNDSAPFNISVSGVRGNQTEIRQHKFSPGDAWLVTQRIYDTLGNLRQTIDPGLHNTFYSYTDTLAATDCAPNGLGQGFVTQVTNHLGQRAQSDYFVCTGRLKASRNENDILAGRVGTTYTYDFMDRPLTITLPDTGGTTFNYHGDVLPLKVTKTVVATPNPSIITSTVFDPLGRVSQTSLDSDPEGIDYTDTTYDLLGRVATVSNPYRTTSDPTYGITQSQYDALGRVTQVTKQDGSFSTVAYADNCTTATDEAGKQRKSCSDGLGRLIEVDEPSPGSAGTPASGVLTISGTLQTKAATSSTPGTGSITISGSEQSKPATPGTAATATVTITGSELSATVPGDPYCGQFSVDGVGCDQWVYPTTTVYDSGTVTMVANGHADSVGYGQGSTAASIAVALANAINGDSGAFVNATATNGVLHLTARQTGTAGNSYSWNVSASSADPADFGSAGSFGGSAASGTMSGGVNGSSLVYDAGTCTATINTTLYSTSFGQGDTTSTIASRLAGVVSGGSLASATASGATISLTAKTTGTSTNYSIISSCSYDSAHFSSPSFTAGTSGSTLTGGANGSAAATDAGTVQMSVGGYSATANYGNGAGQDSTAAAVASDLVAKIQAQLPASNPPFTLSASGATITLNWASAGTVGNVAVTTASTTTQAGNFAKPSFASCATTANPQNCTTMLSGGTDPVLPGLSNPYIALYAYDTLGNLLRVDQKGSAPTDSSKWRTRLFTYNSLSQLLTANNPESGTINYSYDADGNLFQKISPAPNQVGSATQAITFCYDELHRMKGKAYIAQSCPLSSPVVSYTYDAGTEGKGRLTSLTDQAGSATYVYDLMGQMASEQRIIAGVSKSMSYDYNLDSSVKAAHYPSGAVVTYTSTGAGRTAAVRDVANGLNYVTGTGGTGASATYTPAGAITGFVNGYTGSFAGISNTFSYNKRLQPINMSASTPSQTVFSLGYDFHVGNGITGSDNGNVWGITNYKDSSRSQSFTYDQLNRLTSAQNTGTDCAQMVIGSKTKFWGNAYGYDAWGNLLSKTVTKCGAENLGVSADAHNQIHSSSGADYQFDAAGNMTFNATPPATTYTYDQENRITGAAGYTYTYDSDGNRVEKTNGSTGTIYWYMSLGIVGESDLTGAMKSEYAFYGGERVARRDLVAPTGVFYYFSDHLKTTDIVTDAQGNIRNESDFYPWGGELQVLANDSNHYKFTGKERDSETQLDYFGARYYSNGLGRFISADWSATPIPVPYADFTDPQSLNLYGYVRNAPTVKSDADGHCATLCLAAVGAVVGAVIGAGVEAVHEVHSGKGLDLKKIGGSAANGAITGAVAGLTGGASLLVGTAAAGGAAVVGGIAERAIDNGSVKGSTNLGDIAKDATIGVVSHFVTAGVANKALNGLKSEAKALEEKLGQKSLKAGHTARLERQLNAVENRLQRLEKAAEKVEHVIKDNADKTSVMKEEK